MDKNRFEEILARFEGAQVAVLGDFFLDLYIQLDRSLSELSLETQKEAFQAVDLRGQPGAAGVVTNNLRALGAGAVAIGYTGLDGFGYTLRQALTAQGVNTDLLIEADNRFTSTYTKPMMQEVNGQVIELNRIDLINRSPNSDELNQQLAENVHQALKHCDGLLVVEQVKQDGFGTLSPAVRTALAEAARAYPDKPIIVDSRHFAAYYENVSLKMNLAEALGAVTSVDLTLDHPDSLETARACAEYLSHKQGQPVYLTLGEDGLCGMAAETWFRWPGFRMEGPVDIVGAGDSVLAGIGLAACVGATPQEAGYLGNLVGSITVQQLGTTGIATQADLLRRHTSYQAQIKEL